MDPAAELRCIVACAAFVGALRGDVEASVTMVRFVELRLQDTPAAFAPAVLASLRRDLHLVVRDLDNLLAYVIELEYNLATLLDAWLHRHAHLYETQ